MSYVFSRIVAVDYDDVMIINADELFDLCFLVNREQISEYFQVQYACKNAIAHA